MRTFQLSSGQKARSVDSAIVVQSTIGDEIQHFAELQPERPAIVASGFAPLSYRELQSLIEGVRTALRSAGFDRDARIAIAMRDGPQAALAIVAVACSAVGIPLNPRQTVSEIEITFGLLRPDAVLVMRGAGSAARFAAEGRGLTVIEATQSKDGTPAFELVTPEMSTTRPDRSDDPEPGAPAFILQTSGTTAEPKLVPYSHRNMLATAAMTKAWYDLTPQDRCLSVSPVFYAHGLKLTVFTPLLTGGTVTFPTDASKFDYREWFEVLRPTWFSAGPTHHRLIFDQMQSRAETKVGHALRFVTAGLAAHSPEVMNGLQRMLGVPVMACYGASEASLISSNEPPPGRSKRGTVGVPWPDTVVVAAEDGRRLPPGAQGEILVGGPTVIAGYLNSPELNRTRFVDGWFKTGDIGVIDDEGFLTIHGRKDDLISRGGEKISPGEIDDALMRHPAISEAAAFAVPHPRLGEDVAAAVVLRSGMTATPIELRKYLLEQLAAFKVPRRIVICNELPKGQTGKVVRRQLTEFLKEKAAAETQIPQQTSDEGSNLLIQLTEIWERLLKVSPLSLDDDFFEKGGDSLLAMEMLAELESLTGRSIPNAILFEASTIGQLAQKLSERGHLNQKPKALIALNWSENRRPLFFFHDAYNGRGYYVITLARLLGPDQPLLIIAPHGDGNEPIPPTIEAMAADRLQLILDAQREGPYWLCGACLGGIVAFEVARQLIAAGKEVELVAMLDSPTFRANRSVQLLFSTMRRARPFVGPVVDRAIIWTHLRCAQVQRFCNVSWARRWNALKRAAEKIVARGLERSPIGWSAIRHTMRDPGDDAGSKAQPDIERLMKNVSAMAKYSPKPLAVKVAFFSIDFGARAWRRISPDLEVIKSPGSHGEPDVADIAEHLKAQLEITGISR